MEKDITERYRDAEKILQGELSDSLVMNDAVFPHWIEGKHHFWYTRKKKLGYEYRLVDAEGGENIIAFDHEVL